MLIYASTLEECPTTGTMLVHWVRKVRIVFACFFSLLIEFSWLHWLMTLIVFFFLCFGYSSHSFVATENT